ncbi:DUF559 domain-containing protein [Mammaliicoccus sciuri]|uniref:DUF559 domain-containing protein n=1 Tax=Mammaliicoccus sciuri TaxID=1296 RepID=UPI0021D1436F|nr:DUF559 domain-containing protein [Mammaliicoccus sciuri]UXU70213.1 DUF559 domain-containing protein [Mammaliicoccus sciuri]
MKRAEYRYQVGEVVNDTLRIVSQTRIKTNSKNRNGKNYTIKGYIVESIVYPDAPKYEVKESSLKLGSGCIYLRGLRVYEGNSLWSKLELRKYIVDVEKAKNTTPFSRKKIKLACPICWEEKMMHIVNLVRRGFSCSTCSSHTSYPELFFSAYNKVMGLNFQPQQRFNDFKGYIFDFVNYETRTIVETHGKQHYDEKCSWYERTQKSDIAKRDYCINNNWLLIELDCSKSEFKFIKESINNTSVLPNVTNETEILEIIESHKHYDTKKVIKMYNESSMTTYQIAEKLDMSFGTVNNILKRNNIELRKGGHKKGYAPNRKQVRCVTTNQTFSSISQASEYFDLKSVSSITNACSGRQRYAGKHPITGEKLRWEYVVEQKEINTYSKIEENLHIA